MISQLIISGLNIARLNFSHGSYEYHAGTIANVRAAVAGFEDPRVIGIALDTKGPEIRTGLLAGVGSFRVRGGKVTEYVSFRAIKRKSS